MMVMIDRYIPIAVSDHFPQKGNTNKTIGSDTLKLFIFSSDPLYGLRWVDKDSSQHQGRRGKVIFTYYTGLHIVL